MSIIHSAGLSRCIRYIAPVSDNRIYIYFREEQSFLLRFPPFARRVSYAGDGPPTSSTAIPSKCPIPDRNGRLLISITPGRPAEARARKTRACRTPSFPRRSVSPFFFAGSIPVENGPCATYIVSGRLRRSLYGEKAGIDSNAPSRSRRSSRRVLACKSLSNIAYIIHTISGRVRWNLRRAYTLDIRLGSTLSGTPRCRDAALNSRLACVVRGGTREICRTLK